MNTSETPSVLFHLITANLSKHLSNFISNISLRQLAVEHFRTIEGQQVEGRALTIFILSIALHFGAWSVKQICKLKLNILINFSEDWEIFHVKTWLRLSPPLLFWWITKYKLKNDQFPRSDCGGESHDKNSSHLLSSVQLMTPACPPAGWDHSLEIVWSLYPSI